MSEIPILDTPQNLSMNNVRAILNKYGGLAKACRFLSVIRPGGALISKYSDFAQELMYLCESTEIPGRGMLNLDLSYYGPNFKLPIQTQYEDINMTFLCRTESWERQFFDDWMLLMNPINTFDFNYRDDYASSIDIYQLSEEEDTKAQYKITLHNAFPLLVNPQPVTWMDDNFQRLVVSFTYTYWSRPGFDPTPGTYDLVRGRTTE